MTHRPSGQQLWLRHLLCPRSEVPFGVETEPAFGVGAAYPPLMLRLLRLAVLVVLSFLTIGLAIGLSRPETGPVEDIGLVVGVVALLALGVPARRIGTHVE